MGGENLLDVRFDVEEEIICKLYCSLNPPISNGATDCETPINGVPAITRVCSALADEFCVDDCCGGDADNMETCDL